MKRSIAVFVAMVALAVLIAREGMTQGTLGPAGDITSVQPTAGGGLTGGGTRGPVSLGLSTSCDADEVLAWDGDSWECAAAGGLRDDCDPSALLVWDGDSWECGVDSTGSSYLAGNGLSLSGAPPTTFDVNTGTGITITADAVTANLAGASCSAGQFLTALSATGTGTCSSTAISGTIGTLPKFATANTLGNSIVTESAGTISVGGNLYVTNLVDVDGVASSDSVDIIQARTSQTGTIRNLDSRMTGSWSTATGPYVSYAGYFSNTMTGDTEADSLTHYGLYAEASGGDFGYGLYATASAASGPNAYAGYFDAGRVLINGDVQLGNATSDTVDIDGDLTVDDAFTALGTVVLGDAATDTVSVAGDLTITDVFTTNGNSTIGNASSDTLTINATTTFEGPVGRIKGVTEAINTAGGTQSNLAVAANTAIVKYTTTAGANTNLTGIAITGGNEDGDVIDFMIAANIVVTISVETTSTAVNRISSQGDGSDWTFRGPTTVQFIYDATLTRWAMAPISNRLTTVIVSNNAILGDANSDTTSIRIAQDTSTAATLSSCGSSPTITGGSWGFVITFGTGGITACTATFAATKTNPPACVVTMRSSSESVYLSSVSATAITITARSGTTDISSDVADVICVGDA